MADIISARVPAQNQNGSNDPLSPFGLDFIDSETGGLIRDKLYLLYGPHSAWKTAIAIYFIYEGLRTDQRALYVTSQDPEAVIVQAERLGFNLTPYLRENRLTILSYQPRISQQLALLSDYQRVMSELKRLSGLQTPDRIVFDPIEVLISTDNKIHVLPSTKLLIEALKELNATTLCLLDESEEAHTQMILKEVLSLSFGAFQVTVEANESRVFHFRKVIWNPREYPHIPLTLRSRQGVQVLEPAETGDSSPRLSLASDEREASAPIDLPRTVSLLLIDDDEFYHEMLQEFLTDRYRVEQVRDSVEAISRLLEHTYDIILVNLNMPRVDGKEVCLRIRQHQPHVSLIAFSNKLKRGADVASILRTGVDMFISRPLAFNQVKATIEALLRRPAGERSFDRARKLIQKVLDEQHALRNIPRIDPKTQLNTREYFEQKLLREIDKASLGDYSFSIVGYHVEPTRELEDFDRKLGQIVRPLLRAEDLMMRRDKGFYLAYLDECLAPGVRRFNDRLRKALKKGLGGTEFSFHYRVATFPMDGRDYDELLSLVLEPQSEPSSPQLKRLQ